MEPRDCNGGNRSQIGQAQTPPKHAKTVAVGCDQLPFGAHGKEGSPVRVWKRALREATQKSGGFRCLDSRRRE
jgi:hypothetical protein